LGERHKPDESQEFLRPEIMKDQYELLPQIFALGDKNRDLACDENLPEPNSPDAAFGKIQTVDIDYYEMLEPEYAEHSPTAKTLNLKDAFSKSNLALMENTNLQKVEMLTNDVLDFLVKEMLEDDEFLNCLVRKDPKNNKQFDGIYKINHDIEDYLCLLVDKLNGNNFFGLTQP
jgi:hypothetical protein